LWHNSKPQKIAILVWLILNHNPLVGNWLAYMGLLSSYKVCDNDTIKMPQYYTLDCPKARTCLGHLSLDLAQVGHPHSWTFM